MFDRKASYAGAADSSLPANNSVQIHRNSLPQNLLLDSEKARKTQITLKSRLLSSRNVLAAVQLKIPDFGDVPLCLWVKLRYVKRNEVKGRWIKLNNDSFHNQRGHAVAQLVEALRYKPEGRGFDSR